MRAAVLIPPRRRRLRRLPFFAASPRTPARHASFAQGLAGGTALALVLVSGAVLWALQSNRTRGQASEELYSIDHHNVADGLAGLPRDYAGIPRDVPRLGPPLPGDLGRPIVAAQSQSGPLVVDPEQQRMSQETEAARTSKVFAATNGRPSVAGTPAETTASAAPSSDEAFAQNGQDRKLAFVNASVDRRTTSPDRVTKPASPYVVQAGSIISAALITAIRSDLPGQIIAQVTENIFDSPTGRTLLVPQGTRLIGIYDSQVSFGQSRVSWSGHASSCRPADPSSLSASLAPIPQEMQGFRTRLIITGARCSRRRCCRPYLVSEPS